jgi:hypothetical protein
MGKLSFFSVHIGWAAFIRTGRGLGLQGTGVDIEQTRIQARC